MEQLLSNELLEWLQNDIEDDIDRPLLAASKSYEKSLLSQTQNLSEKQAPPIKWAQPPSNHSPMFATPKTEEEICNARAKGVPSKTIEDTKYCVNLWNEWKRDRQETLGGSIPDLTELSRSQLQHWLTRFVLEVRKKDGSEYVPNTPHHICCGVMRHLRWNGQPSLDFFTDSDFANFKATLDAKMKRLQSAGVGSKKRQAKVLRWEATVAEGSTGWCYPTDSCRHHGLHEWPLLLCEVEKSTDNWESLCR